jgi:hypothetical protein
VKKIMEFLEQNKNCYCDDCISYKIEVYPRQQVNQICRMLSKRNMIVRKSDLCFGCKKIKIINCIGASMHAASMKNEDRSIAIIEGRKKFNKIDNIKEITKSKEAFMDLLKIHNKSYRIQDKAFYFYRDIIKMHQENKNVKELMNDDKFIKLLYETLDAWNMNSRGSTMVSFEEFKNSVESCQEEIAEMSRYSIENLNENDIEFIFSKVDILFNKLNITTQHSKIVGVSKTLHFLLPELFMPVDRTYTMNFFYNGYNYKKYMKSEIATFKEIFKDFYRIIKDINISKVDIDNVRWNTSLPKLVDNALIEIVKRKKRRKS